MPPLFHGILIDLQILKLHPPTQHPTPLHRHSVPPSAEGACDPDGPGQALSSQARGISSEMAIFLETFYVDARKSVYASSIWNNSH